ncbi:MAG: glycosyltransferase family 2 protein [Candidatus Omnitrophica bacterium]|nr:glycosyltransferase family 2 protein [Candidatus Omnitrophota bacterium]MBU1933092.1 glycosyltransferase family 2 protein [Candidatus Omnitrophota bacterium]
MARISIVIPAYNEEASIKQVLMGLKKLDNDYEVIVVDDGSKDNTYSLVKESGVKVIRHPYNKGYGAAIKTGTKVAGSEIVFLMDADTQHNPADIPRLCEYMEEFDMVVGQRSKGSKAPLARRLGKWALKRAAVFLARMDIPDLNSGFRVVKKEVILKFMHILPDTFSLSTTLTLAVIKGGYTIKYVPITTKKRVGKSSLNLFRDGYRTILLILSTIALFDPLRVFTPLAISLFIPGSIYTGYQLVFFHNVPDSGILLVISGMLIFFFGILAEQISQMRRQMR